MLSNRIINRSGQFFGFKIKFNNNIDKNVSKIEHLFSFRTKKIKYFIIN